MYLHFTFFYFFSMQKLILCFSIIPYPTDYFLQHLVDFCPSILGPLFRKITPDQSFSKKICNFCLKCDCCFVSSLAMLFGDTCSVNVIGLQFLWISFSNHLPSATGRITGSVENFMLCFSCWEVCMCQRHTGILKNNQTKAQKRKAQQQQQNPSIAITFNLTEKKGHKEYHSYSYKYLV